MRIFVWDTAAANIQNGSPDGVALFKDTVLIEFLSYEGTFVATGTPAAGASTDIGVSEEPAPALGLSLQKTGNIVSGTWQGPLSATKGFLNGGKFTVHLLCHMCSVVCVQICRDVQQLC